MSLFDQQYATWYSNIIILKKKNILSKLFYVDVKTW